MRFLFILIILIIPLTSIAQDCNCLLNFDYVVKSIAENYAGYPDKIKSKNRKEFQKFTSALRNKAKSTQSFDSCYVNLKNWVNYFKDNHLRVQLDWKFRKQNPEAAKQLNNLFAKKSSASDVSEKLDTRTSIRILDHNTTLIRLPSFEWNEKKTIDSVLKTYKNEITQRTNLILDIRGNSGGTDYAFSELMPFIYSDPIFIKPDEYRSTEENIRILESNLKEKDISVAAKEFLSHLTQLMKQHPNEFVNPSGKAIFEIKLDSVYKSPSKVAILIDRNTASSAESFLLMAMQSKKVTVYGENSAGMLDYNNTQFFDVPCRDLNLVIPIGRSKRLPDQPIDNIGITPEIPLNEKVSDKIKFIIDQLNEQ